MPLASSLSSAQKRAESVEMERRQQERRQAVANGLRRTSLPLNIPSSTVATKQKVDRRRSLRRQNSGGSAASRHTKPPIANENGHCYSPPETRSAKKEKLHQNFVKNPINNNGIMLTFSPPNQAENERREKERIQKEEQERARRIAENRQKGQLLVFSPSNRLTTTEYFLDLSPSNEAATASHRAGSSLTEDSSSSIHQNNHVDSAGAAKRQEEMLLKIQENMNLLISEQSQNRDRRHSDADVLLKQVQQMVQKDDSKTQLLQDLQEANNKLVLSKEAFATEKTRLEMHLELNVQKVQDLESLRASLQQQTAALQNDKTLMQQTVRDLKHGLEDAKNRLEEHQIHHNSLQQEYELEKEAASLRHQQLGAANKTLKLELADVQASNSNLQGKIADYSAKIQEYESTTIPNIESQVQTQLDAIQNLQVTLETRSNELDECKATNERMTKVVADLKQKNEEERRSLKLLNEDSRMAFEQMRVSAESKDQQIADLADQLQASQALLQTERDTMAATKESLNAVKERLICEQKQLNDALEETMLQLDQTESDKKALEKKISKLSKQLDDATAANGLVADERKKRETVEQRLAEAQELAALIETKYEQSEERRVQADQYAKQKEIFSKDLERSLKMTMEERDMARNNMQGFSEREQELYSKLHESDRIRREMHARIMQLMGNIRVFVRVRPPLPSEIQSCSHNGDTQLAGSDGSNKKRKRSNDGSDEETKTPFTFPGVYDRGDKKKKQQYQSVATAGAAVDDLTKNLIEVQEPYKDRGGLSDRRKKWRFGFDNVFSPEQGQDEVWEATEPLIQSAVDGFNVTVFAYGQTGSGKTYTMLGENGLIGRSVHKMFEEKREIEALSREETQVSLSVELLEVYNEKVRDLLSSEKDQDLTVTSNEVVGNIVVETATEDEVMKVMALAQSRRCVKATGSNAESSRSHMIFTIHFNVTAQNGVQRSGKLNICDLAGSERLAKSGAHLVGGALLEESKNINKSLSVLSNVIERLQAGDKNVPFRESKLTFLLKNSLSGNSKTLAIVCCNPLAAHVQESLCSLRFAEKVNRVDLKAVANFSC